MKIFFSCLAICLFMGCDSAATQFELCGGKLHPYYYPELKYEGDFYTIKAHFYTNYKAIDSDKNNGIVKIRFHVNCNGETGNFKTETYSLAYQSIEMDHQITAQLLALTQTLENWIPAKSDDGEAVNSHKFFAFKIIDGQLTDILPK